MGAGIEWVRSGALPPLAVSCPECGRECLPVCRLVMCSACDWTGPRFTKATHVEEPAPAPRRSRVRTDDEQLVAAVERAPGSPLLVVARATGLPEDRARTRLLLLAEAGRVIRRKQGRGYVYEPRGEARA